jgi:hypothetical protein
MQRPRAGSIELYLEVTEQAYQGKQVVTGTATYTFLTGSTPSLELPFLGDWDGHRTLNLWWGPYGEASSQCVIAPDKLTCRGQGEYSGLVTFTATRERR